MCGRFAQIEPVDVIAQRLQVDEVLVQNTAPRYNICPGEDIVALVHTQSKKLVELRWGLIPYWAKDASAFKPLINARVETVIQKPSFKRAFFNNRCIIPASGFYEWKKEGAKKIPYFITVDDFFGLAGIYDRVTINDKQLLTCAILTTAASEQMSIIHNRMPVIIRQSEFEQWLHNKTSSEMLEKLMQPFNTLVMYPVSPKVNNPSYKEPDCISPV
ncbi:MAG: SOS response-associated peptidase [Spirochaetota bacterium]|nr:SOS response-associated peptidase [Spirochaetota bacterium]